MQEKEKNASTVKFLTVFGMKVNSNEHFFKDDDCCDQRAPLNNPEELYNSFVVPSDVMSELESEELSDFDNDITDYDDRTDLGIDIAEASQLDLRKIRKTKQKPVSKPVEKADEEPAAE